MKMVLMGGLPDKGRYRHGPFMYRPGSGRYRELSCPDASGEVFIRRGAALTAIARPLDTGPPRPFSFPGCGALYERRARLCGVVQVQWLSAQCDVPNSEGIE